MEMIERMCEAFWNDTPHSSDWNKLDGRSPAKRSVVRGMRAALAAMREPTEAQILAMHDGPLCAQGEDATPEVKGWLREMWRSAIDAILTPAPNPTATTEDGGEK